MSFIDINISEPHFSNLRSCKKTVEGRLYRNKWTNLNGADTFVVHNGNRIFYCRVISFYRAKTFGDLFDHYGENLLPGVSTREEAERIYRAFYSDKDVKTYGVIGFKVLKLGFD